MNIQHQDGHVSDAEIKGFKFFSLLLIAAGWWLNLRFWWQLAATAADLPSHLAIATATTIGVYAATASLVRGWRIGSTGTMVTAAIIILVCAGANSMNGTGFYSGEEEQQQGKVVGVTKNGALDDTRIEELRDRLKSLHTGEDGGGSMALQADIDRLEAEKTTLEKQRKDFAARNVIKAGVKPTQEKIDALDVTIAAKRSQKLTESATHGDDKRKEIADVQTRLDAAIAEAKTDNIKPKVEGANFAGALFRTFSKLFGITEEQARANFFSWLPIVHEAMVLLGSLILHTLGTKPKALTVAIPPAIERPTAPNKAAVQVEERQNLEPEPISARSSANAASAPRAAREAIVSPGPVGEGDYLRELFSDWTPENKKLTGRTEIGKRLGITPMEASKYHNRAKLCPYYKLSTKNQPYSEVDQETFAAAMI